MTNSTDKQPTRRAFLGTTLALGAGVLGSARRGRAAPSETVRVAHIGLGGMGNAHVNWFSGLPEVTTVALCDVDANRLASTLRRLKERRPETPAEPYADFRRVLDRDDIDVVTIATPDHWHALIAIHAFAAGKDVYGEKPVAHNLREAETMQRHCHRHGRVFQLGTQIHAEENYHRVVELVRSGLLGRVHTVHMWKNGGSPGLGWPPDSPPPAELDWDLWLGPAPARPYNPVRCHGNFRHFWDYSGGAFADFWCHIADLFYWTMAPGQPRRVSARGEVPLDGIAETPAWIDVTFEYDDLTAVWTSAAPRARFPQSAGIDRGLVFEGERGYLVADYYSRQLVIDGQLLTDLPEVAPSLRRSPGHQREFIEAVKTRRQPASSIDYAVEMTRPMFLALTSFRMRQPLTWDAAASRFVSDEAADRLLGRSARAPWHLPS